MQSQSDYLNTNDAADFIEERSIKFVGTEPGRANPDDAGYDLYASHDTELGHGITKIETGTRIEIPAGHVGIIKDRSSMAARGYAILGGVIDAGYTGEIVVLMHNGGLPELVTRGQKIAQLIIVPCVTAPLARVEHLGVTVRGEKGFGSSGI